MITNVICLIIGLFLGYFATYFASPHDPYAKIIRYTNSKRKGGH